MIKMYQSLLLRDVISKKYNIDLNKYAWDKEFTDFVMGINLDYLYENQEYIVDGREVHTGDLISSFKDIYTLGLNIGYCNLTSRYFVLNIPDAFLHVGICDLVVGTKRSIDGNHCWVQRGNEFIDTTLMICIPIQDAIKLGYSSYKILARPNLLSVPDYDRKSRCYSLESESYLPEHGCFSNELSHYKFVSNILPQEYVESLGIVKILKRK